MKELLTWICTKNMPFSSSFTLAKHRSLEGLFAFEKKKKHRK